ncbi:ATP-dependent DNA helicase PcrA [Maioricimonas rarisocia]|uniref:DNA 3'-5' helicase n=1 Tax=Maioricimonas rarisocia TaxID=2528026 RepID=A0A517Z7V9_9PLAN|nr:UvrD-helicase domain-containing protein [Maioricimonas rarisocia]QDU38555.1 ATP-dependent DNA helicase PcrA [Maioricimonas rarisocia]
MDRLGHLNPAQREAVQTLSGPLLVLAGAGTGKTRVITVRMAELIRNGVTPERILSVTFTNKASKEMLQRTRELLGGRMKKRPWISTFHALCVSVLRAEIKHLGYPDRFAIIDRGDQESIARGVLRDIRVTEKALRPGDLLSVVSRWKSAGVPHQRAAEVADDDKEFLAALGYRRYQEKLRATGSVDFDDLLLLTNRLFREFPEVLERHQRRFDHVQIDEYQDTNGLQFSIIEALVRGHNNICVVGDDDQSIYGWRGAEVRHILGFSQHFPGAKVIRLEENYRCTDRILDMANRLVQHNRDRHKKQLRPNKQSLEDVRFLEFSDETLEAEQVVREIRFLHQQKNVPLRDFAILFRTNEQPRLFEAELRRYGLRYVLLGSQSFYDKKEIRDLLAYLKVIAHPDDEVSLLRIINTPARGIGNTTVEKVMTEAVREGVPFWDMAQRLVNDGVITVKAGAAIDKFRQLLDTFRRKMESQPEKMDVVLRELIDTIDYEMEIERQYKDPQQALMRTAGLDDFVGSLTDYVTRTTGPTLDDYLASVALDGRDDEPDKEKQAAEDAVKLMTLHSAKGLEFPRVYLVGLEEGILPHKRSVDATEKEIAEERRLAYVGITRAQDYLTLSRAETRKRYGKPRKSMPSRFLREMQQEPPRVAVEPGQPA